MMHTIWDSLYTNLLISGDLVLYHQEQPLSGGEKLQHPCPRESNVSLSEIIDDNPN